MNNIDRQEERIELYNKAGGRCESCKEIVCFSDMELAHRIAKTKTNIRKYGRQVIDHPMNKMVTHRGCCNDAQNIGFKTLLANSLALEITSVINTGKKVLV